MEDAAPVHIFDFLLIANMLMQRSEVHVEFGILSGLFCLT